MLENVAFNWLGWDFIKSQDIGALQKELNNEFSSVLRNNSYEE